VQVLPGVESHSQFRQVSLGIRKRLSHLNAYKRGQVSAERRVPPRSDLVGDPSKPTAPQGVTRGIVENAKPPTGSNQDLLSIVRRSELNQALGPDPLKVMLVHNTTDVLKDRLDAVGPERVADAHGASWP